MCMCFEVRFIVRRWQQTMNKWVKKSVIEDSIDQNRVTLSQFLQNMQQVIGIDISLGWFDKKITRMISINYNITKLTIDDQTLLQTATTTLSPRSCRIGFLDGNLKNFK